jgi:hypothetical protein
LIDPTPTRQFRRREGSLLLIVSRRDEAGEMMARLCRTGVERIPGRMRESGRRSRPTFRPLVYAPQLKRHMPKRQPELVFVASLAAAWLRATGNPPAMTADRRAPGPFAKFVKECLDLVGVGHVVNAMNLINKLGRLRRARR